MRRVRRTVPAPGGFGLELIGVPEGTDLELDLRLEAVVEGVLVSGTARAPLSGECGRCLEPVAAEVEAELQELFAYDDAGEETGRLAGDLIDLEPAVRDAVVLALPLTPLCRAECPGLCPGCGARLDNVEPGHMHVEADPRWAALRLVTDENEES